MGRRCRLLGIITLEVAKRLKKAVRLERLEIEVVRVDEVHPHHHHHVVLQQEEGSMASGLLCLRFREPVIYHLPSPPSPRSWVVSCINEKNSCCGRAKMEQKAIF